MARSSRRPNASKRELESWDRQRQRREEKEREASTRTRPPSPPLPFPSGLGNLTGALGPVTSLLLQSLRSHGDTDHCLLRTASLARSPLSLHSLPLSVCVCPLAAARALVSRALLCVRPPTARAVDSSQTAKRQELFTTVNKHNGPSGRNPRQRLRETGTVRVHVHVHVKLRQARHSRVVGSGDQCHKITRGRASCLKMKGIHNCVSKHSKKRDNDVCSSKSRLVVCLCSSAVDAADACGRVRAIMLQVIHVAARIPGASDSSRRRARTIVARGR